jgi:beta-lactamase class A
MRSPRIPLYFVIISSVLSAAAVSLYLYNTVDPDATENVVNINPGSTETGGTGSSGSAQESDDGIALNSNGSTVSPGQNGSDNGQPAATNDPVNTGENSSNTSSNTNTNNSNVINSNSNNSTSSNSSKSNSSSSNSNSNSSGSNSSSNSNCNSNSNSNHNISRQNGYSLIRPLLLARPVNESKELAPLKKKLAEQIEQEIVAGNITSASVHVMSFAKGEWTCVNPNGPFNMGSLVKVPLLMTYLYEAETNSQVLNKKIYCEQVLSQNYASMNVQAEHFYSVKDLLKYMIAGSDINATFMLYDNVNVKLFKKTFTVLELPEPNLKDKNYKTTARLFSRFLTVLYDATYLSRSSSEQALRLLNQCSFKDGLTKGLPPTVKMAHKFGEWADSKNGLHGLHETAIVYLNDNPYLITVMTQGNDKKNLSEEVGKISKIVYETFAPAN